MQICNWLVYCTNDNQANQLVSTLVQRILTSLNDNPRLSKIFYSALHHLMIYLIYVNVSIFVIIQTIQRGIMHETKSQT